MKEIILTLKKKTSKEILDFIKIIKKSKPKTSIISISVEKNNITFYVRGFNIDNIKSIGKTFKCEDIKTNGSTLKCGW